MDNGKVAAQSIMQVMFRLDVKVIPEPRVEDHMSLNIS